MLHHNLAAKQTNESVKGDKRNKSSLKTGLILNEKPNKGQENGQDINTNRKEVKYQNNRDNEELKNDHYHKEEGKYST